VEPKSINTRDAEAIIQTAIIARLKVLDWYVKDTHGNMYQSGFPDLFCCHTKYGHRWVEVKCPHRSGTSAFTPAQLQEFPKLCAHGSGVWVATTHVDIEKLLMGPYNWWQVLANIRSAH
jgi:hypothetical protein